MQHDISKLRDQVQQISLSQKVAEAKMDGLKIDVQAKINGLKKFMEANMDGLEVNIEDLKKDMEDLKGGLTKLLHECFLMAKR